jgi:hypothetical protein
LPRIRRAFCGANAARPRARYKLIIEGGGPTLRLLL